MHKIAATGRIVLLVTHRLGDLVEHCKRVAVVRDGRVRAMLEGEALTEDGLARQLVTESGVAQGVTKARNPPGLRTPMHCSRCATGRIPRLSTI